MRIAKASPRIAALLLPLLVSPWAWPDTVHAQPAGSSESGTTVQWDVRWRYEHVDNDSFADTASANTLRLRLGLKNNWGQGWTSLIEGAGVVRLDGDYNSGANGRTRYPGIADPSGGELNQAWVGWSNNSFGATVGRQRLQFDNQRWIGNSAWRQHEQTFDAVSVQWQPTTQLRFRYAWLDRVNRVAGQRALNPLARERSLDTHLFNLAWTQGLQEWVAYTYLHKDRDVPSASTTTSGLRWSGNLWADKQGFGWALEAARQRDYSNNPADFSASYWLVEPSWSRGVLKARLGWEHLGSDGGNYAVQTPLGSLHPFNGWNDLFGATPAGGLDDRYLALDGRFNAGGDAHRFTWSLAHHQFKYARGTGLDAREWDASIGWAFRHGLSAQIAAARLRNSAHWGHSPDDRKLWLQVIWNGSRDLR